MQPLRRGRSLHIHHVDALAVLEGDKLVGIISERDVITHVIVQDRDPHLTSAGEVMTSDPQTIGAAENLADALEKMLSGHFRHLPVTCGDKMAGMISMRDIPTETASCTSASERPTPQPLYVDPAFLPMRHATYCTGTAARMASYELWRLPSSGPPQSMQSDSPMI